MAYDAPREGAFLSDVQLLGDHARKQIDQGPITNTYDADVERFVDVLNNALATELVCVLRYKRHYFMAQDLLEMIKDDLVPERVAIEAYTEIIRWTGQADVTTRRLLEDILSVEEEHADDMLTLLKGKQ